MEKLSVRPVAVIQARMGSTRLPGKVLRPVLGRPMLWHIAQRVRAARPIAEVVVATSEEPGDEPIRRFCRAQGLALFAGSEADVLDRFYGAAIAHQADPVVRITADCPFVDSALIEQVAGLYATGEYDHVAVATGAGAIFLEGGRFPDGLDAECFSFAALARAWREATSRSDREHVTPYIYRNRDLFRCYLLTSPGDYSQLRWTVDNEADFELVSRVYEALYREDRPFLMPDILSYLAQHPELVAANRAFIGQEGYLDIWEGGTRKAK